MVPSSGRGAGRTPARSAGLPIAEPHPPRTVRLAAGEERVLRVRVEQVPERLVSWEERVLPVRIEHTAERPIRVAAAGLVEGHAGNVEDGRQALTWWPRRGMAVARCPLAPVGTRK